ncbi:MAG: hypothetical protein ABJF11_10865 [Reichenbachiella sp.]|uniref:hypothetical protein n=1 Tax=Reichenbachiella sp. TaxID=2184521 RepID=UPI0032638E25
MSTDNNRSLNYIEIPKLFYNDLTGAPMQKCISCERDLLDGIEPYMIEKALKPYDGLRSYSTVFEYAMCMQCMEGYQSKISKESMAKINDHFAANIDIENRRGLIENNQFDDLDAWVNKCIITKTEVESTAECQIYAQCIGDQLIMADYPYMISGIAMEEIVKLLSPETLDEFGRLQEELIGPSEFQDLLKGGPKVFL